MAIPGARHLAAWFNSDDWPELRAICPDLHDTYEEWRTNARRLLKPSGLTENDIEKVVLTPDELRDWQANNGGAVDSKIRARLAIEIGTKRKHRSL